MKIVIVHLFMSPIILFVIFTDKFDLMNTLNNRNRPVKNDILFIFTIYIILNAI